MVSYSRQQAIRWALLLFDNDGCTLIAKTSALEIDDPTKIHPSTTLNFRHGKHNYLAEILAVAGARRDLNAFELNWQETGRARSIEEAQEGGQTDRFLSLQPSESFLNEPVVEAAKVLEDAAEDFDLANILGAEISNKQIQSDIDMLKTNQHRIIDNQEKIMASMTQFMETQTAMADSVSGINGFLKTKLKKAEREEATLQIHQIVVPVLDSPMEPLSVVYDKPASTLAEAILPEGQMNYPEAQLDQVITDSQDIYFPDLSQPTVSATTPSEIPVVSPEKDFPDLPQPTVTDTTPSEIPQVSTEIDFPDLPQPTVTPTTPSEMRQHNTEQRVNIGSIRNPVLVGKQRYQKAINSSTIQKFILALVEGTFSNHELAESNVIGGKGSYGGVEIIKKRLCPLKINAIFTQAALQFNRPVEAVASDRTIRNAINSKCRNKKVLCNN